MIESEFMADGNKIDLVKYGALWQTVHDMDKKFDKIERNVEELLALANKGRGGLWFGMLVVSSASAVVGYFLSFFRN